MATTRKVELTQEKCAEMGASWYARRSPQDIAAYNALGGTGTQACANCLFFASPNGCTVVEDWPLPISPTGLSRFWTAIPEYKPEPLEVVIVSVSAEVDDKAGHHLAGSGNIVERFMLAMKTLFGAPELAVPAAMIDAPSGLRLLKDVEGGWRWLMWVTNKYRDRDGEILEDAAHKEFVDYLDKGGDYPEAWLWHTPGTKWGQADFADYTDGFLVLSGTVDLGMEQVAQSLEKEADRLGVSHGFYSLYSGPDTIGWYRMREASPLPRAAAANVWTGMDLVRKEAALGLSAAKRDWLEGKLGKERVAALENDAAGMAKALETAGVDYKDMPGDAPAAIMSDKDRDDLAAAMVKALTESPSIKAIGDSVAAVKATGEQTAAGLVALTERVKALELSDDDKISDLFKARATPGAQSGARASQSDKNLVTPEDGALQAAGPVNIIDPAFAKAFRGTE